MVKIVEPGFEILEPIDGQRIVKNIEYYARVCYKSENKITEGSAENFLKSIIKSGHESVLEHEKITVIFTCDVGFYKDITRHRAGTSYSIESTRWCNYGGKKFGSEISVIRPCNIEVGTEAWNIWLKSMEDMERHYMDMVAAGCKPDQLRMVLPHSTKATAVVTCNLRSWRHMFKLRAAKSAHPSIQQLMKPLLALFMKEIPYIFDDLAYLLEDENSCK